MNNQTNVAEKCETSVKDLQRELAEKKAAVKAAAKLADWEVKTSARNPQFVPGSVRKATEEEKATMKCCHGMVCEIVCASCGETRIINTQDAFQVKYCGTCKKEAKKEAGKAKRAAKGKSTEEIESQIAALNAMLTK